MKLRIDTKHGAMDIDDKDVVNPLEYSDNGTYNPYNTRPFLIHGEFGCLAIVFASCESDALDEAVDAGKLNGYMLSQEDVEDWEKRGADDEICYLGNASEPFDLTYIHILELPNPTFSFVTLLNAHMEGAKDNETCHADNLYTA